MRTGQRLLDWFFQEESPRAAKARWAKMEAPDKAMQQEKIALQRVGSAADLKRRLQTLKTNAELAHGFYVPFEYHEMLELVNIVEAILELQEPPNKDFNEVSKLQS